MEPQERRPQPLREPTEADSRPQERNVFGIRYVLPVKEKIRSKDLMTVATEESAFLVMGKHIEKRARLALERHPMEDRDMR